MESGTQNVATRSFEERAWRGGVTLRMCSETLGSSDHTEQDMYHSNSSRLQPYIFNIIVITKRSRYYVFLQELQQQQQ